MATDPSNLTPAGSTVERGPLADVPAWLRPAAPVVVMLAMMWAVEIIDIAFRGRLDRFGVVPRQLIGLRGMVFAPFLHAGFGHLIANTLPFLVLGVVVAYSGLREFATVTAIVAVGSGAGMWLFGSANSVQVGASGLVFGYLTYLLTRGFIAHRLSWILGALVIGLFYGSMLWGLVPRHGVSFSGHLFGALGGVGAAWLLHRSDDADGLPGAGDSSHLYAGN